MAPVETSKSAGAKAAPAAKPPSPSKAGRVLTYITLVVAGLGGAYAGGRIQGCSEVREAEGRVGEREQETKSAKSDLETERAKVLRLEARRHLHLTLVGMEERNFGIAQEHLKQAGQLLEASTPEGDLKTLASEVTAFKLTASEDQSKERETVFGFVKKLDQLMPPLRR
jgi:hypothetical protein